MMLDKVSQQPITSPVTSGRSERVETLTKVCVEDLLSAFGLGELRHGRRPLELLSWVPARRLAQQAATYDEIVAAVNARYPGRCPYEFSTTGWSGPRTELFLDSGGSVSGNFQGAWVGKSRPDTPAAPAEPATTTPDPAKPTGAGE